MLFDHLLTHLKNRPVAWKHGSPRRAAVALIGGGLACLLSVCLVGRNPSLFPAAALGALLALLGLALGRRLSRPGRTPLSLSSPSPSLSLLETPFAIAHDASLLEPYRQMSRSLLLISRQPDPVYREAALSQLGQLTQQLERMAGGTLVYEGTEAWRMTYEQLLRSPGIHLYRSVAWVHHTGYWQNEPGLQSLQLNYRLQETGQIRIARIAIMADELWPAGELLPIGSLRPWLHEQHSYGIDLRLVRQSELAQEPELVTDLGIYGSRAVGFQELDPRSRTVRFTLSFDFDRLTAAEERWERLLIYAAAYENLLDRYSLDAYDPDGPAE